jgi:hypothetical protein
MFRKLFLCQNFKYKTNFLKKKKKKKKTTIVFLSDAILLYLRYECM